MMTYDPAAFETVAPAAPDNSSASQAPHASPRTTSPSRTSALEGAASAPAAQQPTSRRFKAEPAHRRRVHLIVALTGPSGAGKTYSALRLGSGMAEVMGGPLVVIDTESGRSKHYAQDFNFLHIDFAPPFRSLDYAAALDAALACRPAVVVIDTLSHEHDGEGGFLDELNNEVDRLGGAEPLILQRAWMAAWRKPKADRRRLLRRLIEADASIILCIRAAERGRTGRDGQIETTEAGFGPISGPEFVYEATLSLLLRPGAKGAPTLASDRPGESMAIKTPKAFAALFREGRPLSEAHGRKLAAWAMGSDSLGAPSAAKAETIVAEGDRASAQGQAIPAARRRSATRRAAPAPARSRARIKPINDALVVPPGSPSPPTTGGAR